MWEGEDSSVAATLRFDIGESAQLVGHVNVVEHTTQSAKCDTKTVWPAESAELPASLDVWFEIEEDSLKWGDTTVGAVAAGDTVVVDANGLKIEPR